MNVSARHAFGPGQRAAKNLFESHGFAARSIIMCSADRVLGDDG
jgi:hypothetical protein